MSDAAISPLLGVGAVELVHDGYQFTEGPQWRAREGVLVFSDIPGNTIYSYAPGAVPIPFRTPSGNANGLAVFTDAALIAAEHGTRSISRDGIPLVSTFEGKRLNSPNDAIVSDTGIYFTDPPFGISEAERELDFNGIFRFHAGQLTASHRGALTERPNGIAFSPDRKTLYVSDSLEGTVWAYAVNVAGDLVVRTRLAQTSAEPDGIAIDKFGNLFVATERGVEVFAPWGERWGVIDVPQQPSNCAFGDPDGKTLYITARTAVHRVRLLSAGLPEH